MHYPSNQNAQRERLYAAHQKIIDLYWDDAGQFIGQGPYKGDFRISLWHCLSFLAGDPHCIEKANRIILAEYSQRPCHFSVGASIEVLIAHRQRLADEVREKLETYVRLNLPCMSTEDLKIRGGNDNHPFKAMHDLVVGGELLSAPHYVERGLFRLRKAVERLASSGFPGEYNSPVYTPVSIIPLAGIVNHSSNEEARDLALRLERFYWRDLAVHFHPQAGIPAGPMSRAYYDGTVGNLANSLHVILMYLYPERFEVNIIEELYGKREQSEYVSMLTRQAFAFFLSHPAWLASTEYHLTPELEKAIFERPAGTYVRGTTEGSTQWIRLDSMPEDKVPPGSPRKHFMGPRRSLLSTYFGDGFSLGTSQYPYSENAGCNALYATIVRPGTEKGKVDQRNSAVYYSRMFFDENYPFKESPEAPPHGYFREYGETRILQDRGSALVHYNPNPYQRHIQRIRVGLFRPLTFSSPDELYVGEMPIPSFNITWHEPLPVAIREGNVYIGMIPMMLHNYRQGRKAVLQIHTYSDHLAILLSAFEDWAPRDFSYEELIETNSGFVFEIHSADDFKSFADFRQWLARSHVDDDYYLFMRATTYEREGLRLATEYCPFHPYYSHAAINGAALPLPVFHVDGMPDPHCGLEP